MPDDKEIEQIIEIQGKLQDAWNKYFDGRIQKGPINSNLVDHPAHYNQIPGIERIDVVENFNFNVGNAIKYLWRAGLKGNDPVEDLKKAAWYCQREIDRISGKTETKV